MKSVQMKSAQTKSVEMKSVQRMSGKDSKEGTTVVDWVKPNIIRLVKLRKK